MRNYCFVDVALSQVNRNYFRGRVDGVSNALSNDVTFKGPAVADSAAPKRNQMRQGGEQILKL